MLKRDFIASSLKNMSVQQLAESKSIEELIDLRDELQERWSKVCMELDIPVEESKRINVKWTNTKTKAASDKDLSSSQREDR